MALDAEAVLWALRGLPARDGVSADELARFLSNDATLSEDYSRHDVSKVLDALVAAGDVSHVSTTGPSAFDRDEPTHGTMLYRLRFPESPILYTDEMQNAVTEAVARQSNIGAEAKTRATPDELDTYATLRVDELERERDAFIAERDRWRQRAESAEQEVACARSESCELRSRILGLERLVEFQRSSEFERSEKARRTAVALARARHELERLEQSIASGRSQPQATRPRPTPRGNWLR